MMLRMSNNANLFVICNFNLQASFLQSFVQMSFHDCVDGCDGCMDWVTAEIEG